MARAGALAFLALGILLQIAAPGWAQPSSDSRIALVIGNAAYREAPLKNPVNDARAMGASLRALGFDVIARENATRDQMARAILDFSSRARQGGSAVFFYAGHGMQVRGKNYLIPVDASIASEGAAQFASVDIGTVLAEMEQAGTAVNIVILDACRNNPFERRMRGAARGLAAIDAARGSLIAYATAPGSVASDGDGQNGVYTAALLHALTLPGLKAEEVFKRVRLEVTGQTGNQQTPWESSSLTGDFVFNRAASPATAVAGVPASTDREALFWQSIKDSRRAEDFSDYLARYPAGEFAGLARRRIEELRPAQVAAAPVYAPQSAPAPVQPAAVAAPPLRPSGPSTAKKDAAPTPFDGTWIGRFTRRSVTAEMKDNCRSSVSELEVVGGRIVDGFLVLDDGRRFEFTKSKVGRLEFDGVVGADGRLDFKVRMFDNFNTNFMNIVYNGQAQNDAGGGSWRDDFGQCRGDFTLERKR